MKFRKKISIIAISIFTIAVTAISLNSGSNGETTDRFFESDSTEFYHKHIQFNNLAFSYDTFITQSLAQENIPGLAVVIVKDNQVVFMKPYGVKEFGTTDSVDINTVFRLGSVSKGFASVLTGILVDEKKLSWDDKVIKYLPDFSLKDTSHTNKLTIRNILSQTTGLPTHTFTDMLDYNVPFEEIKPLLVNVNPIAPPGKLYSYQNVTYSLIADIVKSATGQDYNTLVEHKIFIPLYMQHASLDYESMASDSNVAMPHVYAGNHTWKTLALNNRYYSVPPASGVNASISDMARWLLALNGNYPEFIPKESLGEIYTPQIYTPIKRKYRNSWKDLEKLYYGLGWRVFEINGNRIIYHGGYVKGYRAEIAFNYEEKTGIAVLFNSNCRLSNVCIPKFWELYFNCSNNTMLTAEN
ncbi:MAG: beta-lactamase family protein [Bacteroidales bacterium]|nr:beta-lactamase family protein [Bacteroidales bacterium]